MGHTHRYQLAFKKKNQVKSPNIGLVSRKPVQIRQSGRTGNWGVTSWYQSLGLGVSGRVFDYGCTYMEKCWPNADVPSCISTRINKSQSCFERLRQEI